MTLLTRIEKALEGLRDYRFTGSESQRYALDRALTCIRQEFAKPPTDEEVKAVAWQIAMADARDEPDDLVAATKLTFGRERYLKLARAAIAADRGVEDEFIR